jgi:hypothetical protein
VTEELNPPHVLQIKRYEITEVKPDRTITLAMDKQVTPFD